MNLTTRKYFSFFAACLVVIFCAVSFLGIHSRWGYTINNHIKGWQNLRFGFDFNEHTELILKPEDENLNLNDENILDSIQTRLNFLGFRDNKIDINETDNSLILKFSQPAGQHDFDSQTLTNIVGNKGDFKIIDAKKINDFMSPDSNDESAITSDDICYAHLITQKNETDFNRSYDPEYGIRIKLNQTGTEKLANLTNNLLTESLDEKDPSKDGAEISVILNSIPIYNKKIKEPIFDGNIEIFNDMNLEKLNQNLAFLKTNTLPSGFRLQSIRTVSPEFGVFFKEIAALVLAVVLIVIGLILTLKFKIVGLVCAICLTGHVAFVLACFTGFFKIYPGVIFNFAAFVASMVSFIVGVISCFIIAAKIHSESKKEHCPFSLAIKNGVAASCKLISSFNLKTIVGATVLMAIFSYKTNLIAFLLTPIYNLLDFQFQFNETIASIAYTLFVGSVGALIFEVAFIKYILAPVTSPTFNLNLNFKKMFSNFKLKMKPKKKKQSKPKKHKIKK